MCNKIAFQACTFLNMTIISSVPAKKYRIKLTVEERYVLEKVRDQGSHKALKYKRALAMLLSDESEQGAMKTDQEISSLTNMRTRTIERLRKRCHEVGALSALDRVPRDKPPITAKITGEVIAHITQIACSEAPEGHSRWTFKLIAEKVVELEVIDSISPSSVGLVLKKVNLNHGIKNVGVSQKKRMPPS